MFDAALAHNTVISGVAVTDTLKRVGAETLASGALAILLAMLISVAWLNRFLDPAGLSPDEAVRALERAGFPVENREDRPNDTMLDVEITSNRGDCMSHLGLAREVAAATGRRTILPELPSGPGAPAPGARQPSRPSSAGAILDAIRIDNQEQAACPRFTARVIRGVRVGPSPEWLVQALESVNQRSVNNIVDASNYVLFELGQPTHTFDLNRLRGARLVIRFARTKERLVALDSRAHELQDDELVVADAERAVSIAGVIGGLDSSVTPGTTDVLLEAAAWNPAIIRRAGRRLRIATDASKRFERLVDPRTIDLPAARCAELILKLAGGELLDGVAESMSQAPPRTVVELRTRRCDAILGIVIPPAEIVSHLESLEISAEAAPGGERIRAVVPPHRPDLSREIDLIEEVARVHGFDHVPILDHIEVEVKPPQREERALRELTGALVGMGFFETVTFSFIRPDEAAQFLPPGLRALQVDEERRRGEPTLRPSVIPSLLRCRKVNHDGGVELDNGVRLFETAAVYAETERGDTIENRNLALLLDAPDEQRAWRELKGVIESCVVSLGGRGHRVSCTPTPPVFPACRDDASMRVQLGDDALGYMALISDETMQRSGLKMCVAFAELNLSALLNLYPPRATIEALPAFPAIDRDLSVVVQEAVTWKELECAVISAAPERLEAVRFVGVYRGKHIGAGMKSVTFRLRFRHSDRTLRHEEVDPQVENIVLTLATTQNATLRA